MPPPSVARQSRAAPPPSPASHLPPPSAFQTTIQGGKQSGVYHAPQRKALCGPIAINNILGGEIFGTELFFEVAIFLTDLALAREVLPMDPGR